MPEMSWERTAEARAALTAIVSDPEYGPAALSNPRTMSNLLKDLLPDAPREKTVMVAAAEAGMADTLRNHVAQGVDSATAVRLTASHFSDNTSFTPEACNWVAGEFAVALGISDSGGAAGPAMSPPGPAQFAPAPAQFAPGPNQFAPGPAQYPPGPAVSPPGPAQFPAGPMVSPPGPAQFPAGPMVSPPGPAQFPAGPAQFPPSPAQYPPSPAQYPPGPAQYPPGPAQYSPGFSQPQPTGYGPGVIPGTRPKSNGLAIASLLCGVGQFLLWLAVFPGMLAAVLALIFGLVSLRQMKRTGEAGRGMAVTGVVLGALGVLSTIIVVIVIIVHVAAQTPT